MGLALHHKINDKSFVEQLGSIFSTNKRVTKQTKGAAKHHKKRYYGNHPSGIHPTGYTRLTKKR